MKLFGISLVTAMFCLSPLHAEDLQKPNTERLTDIALKAISEQKPIIKINDLEVRKVRYEYSLGEVDDMPNEIFVVVFRLKSSVEKTGSGYENLIVTCRKVYVQIEANGEVKRSITIRPEIKSYSGDQGRTSK